MKKKILFVSILAALLMVSMPFVSTLQARTAPATSTSVTKTTTAVDINLNQEQMISLLQEAKSRATTPADEALCQQAISYIYTYGTNWDCIMALTFFSIFAGLALVAGAAGLWNLFYSYFVNDEGNVDIGAILYELMIGGYWGYIALLFWSVVKAYCQPGAAQQSSSSVLFPTAETRTCSLCAQAQ